MTLRRCDRPARRFVLPAAQHARHRTARLVDEEAASVRISPLPPASTSRTNCSITWRIRHHDGFAPQLLGSCSARPGEGRRPRPAGQQFDDPPFEVAVGTALSPPVPRRGRGCCSLVMRSAPRCARCRCRRADRPRRAIPKAPGHACCRGAGHDRVLRLLRRLTQPDHVFGSSAFPRHGERALGYEHAGRESAGPISEHVPEVAPGIREQAVREDQRLDEHQPDARHDDHRPFPGAR